MTNTETPTLPNWLPGAASKERRVAVRHPTDLGALARLQAAPEAAGWWANVLNLSTGGLRMRVCHRCRAGDLLEVDLHSRQGVYKVAVRVVYETYRGDGTWVVGAAFTMPPLSEADLKALLD
jgi:hypothetical protein